jgi:tRNA threonylcarbamoyladenosine biosynthesis protein TsaE
MRECLTTSFFQTKKIGRQLAERILAKSSPSSRKAFVIALSGELGAGKTAFLQGFAKGLGIKQKITSPTFVILKKFKIQNSKAGFKNFYHIDCYRLENPKEILDLGFGEIIAGSGNIVAVEWPDRIRKIMPKTALWIRFDFIDEKTRKISGNY